MMSLSIYFFRIIHAIEKRENKKKFLCTLKRLMNISVITFFKEGNKGIGLG